MKIILMKSHFTLNIFSLRKKLARLIILKRTESCSDSSPLPRSNLFNLTKTLTGDKTKRNINLD